MGRQHQSCLQTESVICHLAGRADEIRCDRIVTIMTILALVFMIFSTTAAAGSYGEEIFERELAVNAGVAIQHSIKIEVVSVHIDLINSAKFRVSSYQMPARVISVFVGDSPTTYKTQSGTSIYIDALSVYGDSVSVRVTGPVEWRVTDYYTVEPDEAKESGTDAKNNASAATVPELEIARTLDTDVAEAGQTVGVTLKIKNIGNGTATEVVLDEPEIRGTYKEGCPATIDDISAGETRRVSYDLKIVDADPGQYELDQTIINYKSESGVSYSSESQTNSLEITAEEVQFPELDIMIDSADDGVITCGDDIIATVTVTNVGNATAGMVNIKSLLPSDVQVMKGDIEPVYESIKPGESKECDVTFRTYGTGKHTIEMEAMWEGGEETTSLEFWAEKSSLEEYYLHILIAISVVLLLIGIIKRHRAYSY